MEIEKMIKKKEDLHFTYVKNEPELRDVFIEKCDEFGIEIFGFDNHDPYLEVYCNDDGEFEIVGTFHLEPQSKELALSDFKPRTKTEFVKVEFDSAWEAIKSYEVNDDLYYCASSTPTYEKMKAGNMKNLLDYSMPIKLYRKVETEIDERQEFIDAYASLRHEFHGQRTYDDFSGFMYDSGKFKLVGSND